MPKRSRVDRAVRKADERIEAISDTFQDELNRIVMQAQARTLSILQGGLTFKGGTIERTAANRRALSSISKVFQNEMQAAGYPSLIQTFVGEWPGLNKYLQDTINAITATWRNPPPPMEFSPDDLKLLVGKQVKSVAELRSVVTSLANQAQTKTLFSTGAMSFSQVTEILAKYTGKTIPQARTLAQTATTTFYRAMADRNYRAIEAATGEPAFFTYEGPDDQITREFCKKMLRRRRPLSREQIEALDNGQGLDPMTSCGGYNCRHSWVLTMEPGGKKRGDGKPPKQAVEPRRGTVSKAGHKMTKDLRAYSSGLDLEGISEQQAQKVFEGLDKAGIEPWLRANPTGDMTLRSDLEGDAMGTYHRALGRLKLRTGRGEHTYGYEWIPGESWSMSKTATSQAAAMQRTFIHELGHHAHFTLVEHHGRLEPGRPDLDKVFEDFFKKRSVAITEYAETNYKEYFAESWTAYVYKRGDLRRFDPNGFKLVEWARKQLGIPLL